MERNHLEAALADLRGKFELVLEDYAALRVALQALRYESREQQELMTFLLKAVAADLAAHLTDTEAHPTYPEKTAGRPASRPVSLTSYRSPS